MLQENFKMLTLKKMQNMSTAYFYILKGGRISVKGGS